MDVLVKRPGSENCSQGHWLEMEEDSGVVPQGRAVLFLPSALLWLSCLRSRQSLSEPTKGASGRRLQRDEGLTKLGVLELAFLGF